MLRSSNNNKDDYQQAFTPYQIEFMAEDEVVTIVPNFKMEELHFMSGTYGPFQPPLPVDVPLWLAISLKKTKKCRITVPRWMSIDELKVKFDIENTNDSSFEELPLHYIEVANLLLSHAQDDIENVNGIRGLIEDIMNRRQSKINDSIRKSVSASIDTIDPLQIDNLTMMEINRSQV
eukprot:gene14868-17581_t